MPRHTMSNKNMITGAANCSVCGPVEMYTKGSNPICPTSRENSMKKAQAKRAKRAVWHRLSNKDLTARTADCSICGPTTIHVYQHIHQCLTAKEESAAKTYAKRGDKIHPYFGITHDEIAEIKANSSCFICGSFENLHLDHDHTTGAIRGVLCRAHNMGLGQFADNIEHLHKAIEYLEINSKV